MLSGIAVKRESAQKYMTDRGLSPSSLGKAILVHEILGLAMLAITWSLAHRWPPSDLPFLAAPMKKINSAIPQQVNWLNSKAGRSYIEASCLRKLIRPITAPGKLYLTSAIMMGLESFNERNDSEVNSQTSSFQSLSKKCGFLSPPQTIRGCLFTM